MNFRIPNHALHLAVLCLAFTPCGLPFLPRRPNLPIRTLPPPEKKGQEYTINVDVNLVVLHATVLDKKGRMVNDLKPEDFRVYEDGASKNFRYSATRTSR